MVSQSAIPPHHSPPHTLRSRRAARKRAGRPHGGQAVGGEDVRIFAAVVQGKKTRNHLRPFFSDGSGSSRDGRGQDPLLGRMGHVGAGLRFGGSGR